MTNTSSVSLLLLLLIATASAFSPIVSPQGIRSSRSSASVSKLNSRPPSSEEDFPPNTEDESSVDWDAEWKKVVKNKDQPSQRPGTEFYKSDAEVTVTKAVNRAADTVRKTSSSLPSASALAGDWRVWLGVIAFVSVAAAVLQAPPDMSGPESYYI